MKRFVLPVMLLLLVSISCGDKDTAGNGAVNEWLPFDAGMAAAKKENKPVVIDFYTSWCKWCKVMDEKTFSEPQISKYLAEHFVSIRINAENKNEILTYKGNRYTPIDLTRSFGVKAFPSLAYLDDKGDLIGVIPGFMPPETFLPFLRYIESECYKKRISFEEFLKKEEECSE